MFGKRIKLFSILGFEVKIDLSWLILAVLITWSLAKGLFPAYYSNLSAMTYWWMGAGGAIGLFVSIVLHELSHSLVARWYGIPMRGITLFIFGGVAEMNDEPKSARAELFMAVAGPIASVILAGAFFSIYFFASFAWPDPVNGVIVYLAFINLVLAAFNMLPAFPLDGGRVLRSLLWSWKNDLRWATQVSSRIGSGFGIALIVLGAFDFISGNFIGGIWLFLIGMFLRSVSQNSYQQLLIRKALEGEPVRRFMKSPPVMAPADMSLQQFIDDYVFKHRFKLFPVSDTGNGPRCIEVDQVKEIPRERWSSKRVRDVARPCTDDNTLQADMDAVKALTRMRRSGNSRLLVIEGGKVTGIVTLRDMMDLLSLKIDLEEKS